VSAELRPGEEAQNDERVAGCNVMSPDPDGTKGRYICTRAPHTEGRHVAHGTDGQPLAFWVDGGQVEEVGE
jgi:hypothetical protein